MNSDTRAIVPSWKWILLLVAVAGVVFAYTVALRWPWFGTVGEPYSAFFVTWPLLFSIDWYREGIWEMKAALCTNPPSIEFPTLGSRVIPLSTPPGTLIPIYIISKVVDCEPTLAWIMAYNLANQLAVALLLACLVFVFLRQIQCSQQDAGTLAIIPILLYLLLPAPLYNHQMHFWSDHAIVVYFALYLLLETLRTANDKDRRWIPVAQGLIVFMGIFTDWFFGVFVPCVYLKRLVAGEMGTNVRSWFWKSVVFWTPFALGLGLFALQISCLGGFTYVFARLRAWTNPPPNDFISIIPKSEFWTVHMANGYGWTGIVLLAVFTAFFLACLAWTLWERVHRRPLNPAIAKALGLLFLMLGPTFLYLLLLPRHAACSSHYFSTLKYGVPLATGPLVLAPVLALAWFGVTPSQFSLARLLGRSAKHAESGVSLLSFVLLAAAAGYVCLELPRVVPQFMKNVPNDVNYRDIGEFLRTNTTYEDVVFAQNSAIEGRVSLFLPFSMKTVHNGRTLYRFYEEVRDIPGPYVINILRLPGEAPVPGTDVAMLLSLSREHRTWNGLQLDKIPKEWFLAFCQRVKPQPPPVIPEDELRRIKEDIIRRAVEDQKKKR